VQLLLYVASRDVSTITSGSQRSREGYIVSSTKEGARARRNRTRAAITTAAALVAATAFAVPAGAASPAPSGNHSLLSFPQRDFISGDGYSESEGPVIVTVVRNDVTIATSTPVTPQDDDKTPGFDGIVEVNHPGGGCWDNTTPDILPGDEIVTTTHNGTGKAEGTTTSNVTASPAELDLAGNVVVHGTAQDAAGDPLPLDEIEQRLIANKDLFNANGRRTLRASSPAQDGTLSYDPVDPITNPAGTNWTATYTGLDQADTARAVGAETRILWLGPAALGNEGTIYETSNDGSIVGGPSIPDCNAPFRQNAIGAVKMGAAPLSLINQSNVGGTLTVSGPYDPDNVSDVALSVAGTPVPVTLGAATWTATVPAAGLPEGSIELIASFTAGGPVGGGAPDNTMTILKDTVAPGAPTANLASGTYGSAQTIVLNADPGATIRFTANGAAPTATSGTVFTAPFTVTSSQTIRAVAVDNHGNASAPSTFAYTIAGPAAQVPIVGTVPAAGGGQGILPARASSLAVSQLTLARRISVTALRARGLRATMNVQEGTNVVRFAIYKARSGRKTGRALYTTTRTPTHAGLFRTTLRSSKLAKLKPGQYVMEVRAGRSAASLGAVKKVSFTVTR
jgi:hypothetical protein